jgi:iron-sulfur cluster repair protein YtfE (RIC family)
MNITPESTIEEVVVRYPDTVQVFFRHGIPAISCGAPIWGTIQENAEKYGVKDLEALLKELNEIAEQQGGLSVKL